MDEYISQSFEVDQLENHYQTVVIGSGIGGLVAANYLAMAGVKVLLIEKHDRVGGYFHGGWHKKYYFDYGTQSHEILGALLPIVEQLEMKGKIIFKKCSHSFISENGLNLKMGTFTDAHQAFINAYPEAVVNINNYFEYYKTVIPTATMLNLDGMKELIKNKSVYAVNNYSDYWSSKPYYNDLIHFDNIPSSRQARILLGRSRPGKILTNFGYRNQSVLSSGLFWHLWQDDYFYTEKGNQDFANKLAVNIIENGGTVVTNTAAKEILTSGNKITGIVLGNNRLIQADNIIANCDFIFTLEKLLVGHPLIHDLMQKAKQTPTSEAFFSAFVGTSIPRNELNDMLKNSHHTWFFPEGNSTDPFNIDFHKNLPVEISAPILNHPSVTEAEGSQIVLQSFSSNAWMEYWKIDKLGQKTKNYVALKKIVGQQLINNAEKVIPDLTKRITYKMFGSPLTHNRYTGNFNGATAGWTWNPKRTLFKLNEQGITTPFTNLFFAGHWTLYPGGLLTAAVSGKLAAEQIIYR